MKVYRYIYTRLTKDISPKGKNGFQTAFVPHDLLGSKEILEIESHIHYPEGLQIEMQSVVFYKTIKAQTYLVLLQLRPLQDAKDEHGRGGAFLCEGFLIAEPDWEPIWRISDLEDLLGPYQFSSMEALLASPELDHVNGIIENLVVDVPPSYWEQALLEFEDEPEEQLLMAVYHAAKTQNRDLAIVVEGAPTAVSARLETCAMFLPQELRTRIGWDDAFDGGKIFFSPLRIFGYRTLLPTTGQPIIFPADGSGANWPTTAVEQFGRPSDPFSNWLLEVCVSPVPRARLDAIYALSEAMMSGRPVSPDMESDSIFEMVNKDIIRKLFGKGLLVHVEKDWVEKLADITSPSQQIRLWLQGYDTKELTHLLEISILHQNLHPETIASAPSSKLIAQGSPTLRALACMWTLESPTQEIMESLPDDQIPEILTMLLRRGSHQERPFAALVAFFRPYLHKLARDPKIAANLRPYVEVTVPPEYHYFREGLAATAVQLGEYGSLRGEPAEWLRLLDRWLAITVGNPQAWKSAKLLGKKQDLKIYPNLKAFALGEGKFTYDLERSRDGRIGLLRCMIEVHGFDEEKLISMGFFDAEIKSCGSKLGILGKVQRLLRR